MTEKELRHLSRSELIEMLIDEIRESDELRARLTAAEEKLNARELRISEAGTLAEAAMRLSGVNSHRLLIRGHRVSDRPGRTVRVTADAARIEPIIVTPVAAIPMLAVLLLWLLLRDAYITRRDRARERVRREWKNRHSE